MLAPYAPHSRVWVDRGVARHVEHDAAAPFASRRTERSEECPGQSEWAEHVRRQRDLEVLALRVAQESERHRSQARGVVDEHVEAAKDPGDLEGDRIDVFLPCDVADDAVRAGMRPGDGFDVRGCAGDEGHVSAAAEKLAHEREAQTRRAARDGDSRAVKRSNQLPEA